MIIKTLINHVRCWLENCVSKKLGIYVCVKDKAIVLLKDIVRTKRNLSPCTHYLANHWRTQLSKGLTASQSF